MDKLYLLQRPRRTGFSLRCAVEEKTFVAVQAKARNTSMNDLVLHWLQQAAHQRIAPAVWNGASMARTHLALTFTDEERAALDQEAAHVQRSPSWKIRQAIRWAMAQEHKGVTT